ncbi:MAG: tripartite tricarboxylate transporter substrate-binding protein [Acidocella sp.]|nr:tripartite tricarboxylate transporter substrate-binding protein [Acidocella sp.]
MMRDDRLIGRRYLLTGAATLGIAAGSGMFGNAAVAATFPDRPISLIIPFGTGGDFDVYGREFAHLMESELQPHAFVEPVNMPGAGGREAIFGLLRDQPDGYNISMVSIPGIFMGDNKKSNADFDLDSLTWLANLGRDPYALAVSVKSQFYKVADLQNASKTREVTFSNSGFASSGYLATRAFCTVTGIRCKIVSGYKGSSDSMVAVIRNDVDAVVHSLATLQEMEKSGFLRIIFVFEPKSSLPGVEDAAALHTPDLGQIFQWRPVAGPPGLPAGISAKISKALLKAAASPQAAAWARKVGATLYPLDQAQTLQMAKAQEALVNRWRYAL